MKSSFSFGLLILSLIMLPGCVYVDYFNQTFKQADTVCLPVEAVRKMAMRKSVVLDMFETKLNVYALLRTDDVARLHEQLFADCSGQAHAAMAKTIDELLAQNKAETVVYILMDGDIRDWVPSLCVNGSSYKAKETKPVELDQWYGTIFGPKATRFVKNVYKVTFECPVTLPCDLMVCNGRYSTTLSWS